MRKLAAKTLLEVLPPEVTAHVHAKLDGGGGGGEGASNGGEAAEQNVAADFTTLVGIVSSYGE